MATTPVTRRLLALVAVALFVGAGAGAGAFGGTAGPSGRVGTADADGPTFGWLAGSPLLEVAALPVAERVVAAAGRQGSHDPVPAAVLFALAGASAALVVLLATPDGPAPIPASAVGARRPRAPPHG